MPAEQSPAFKLAVQHSRQLKEKPTNDELLQLYALFKEGTQDPPFEQSEKPSMFDIKGKAKRNAWSAVADRKLTPEQAQAEYVTLVESLKEKYGFDESKAPEPVGGS